MKKIAYAKLFLLLGLLFCNPVTFSNPCDPNSSTFKAIYTLKLFAGDKSSFCGIGGGSLIKQPKFVIVPNSASDTLTVYNINSSSGALTQVVGSPFLFNDLTSPRFVAVHPNGLFVYVANGQDPNVVGFSIDSSTGNLTSVGIFGAPANTYAIAINSTGNYLYVASFGGREIYLFSIDQTTGALTYIQTFACTPGAAGAGGQTAALFIDSTGNFMYAGNTSALGFLGIVDVFSIDKASGYLTILGAPGPYSFGGNSIAVTVDPLNKFVYGGYFDDPYITGFVMNASTGGLSSIGNFPTNGAAATFVTVEATGKFLYVANSGSADISGFAINSTTGVLTTISGSPFLASGFPSVIYTDPTSSFLYSANTAVIGEVSGYTIDKTTGVLTQISGSPWLTDGSLPFGLGIVSY